MLNPKLHAQMLTPTAHLQPRVMTGGTRHTQGEEIASIDELVFADPPLEIDTRAEDSYWAEHYQHGGYVPTGTRYDEVRAAFRFGWESRRRLPDVDWNIALPRLRSEWNADPANYVMSWSEAEKAARDAWNHAGAQRNH